jgi:hypothetical protein
MHQQISQKCDASELIDLLRATNRTAGDINWRVTTAPETSKARQNARATYTFRAPFKKSDGPPWLDTITPKIQSDYIDIPLNVSKAEWLQSCKTIGLNGLKKQFG